MGTKTLSITEAAYEALAKHKRPGESFTEVILRLAGKRSIRDLADAFTPAEASALAEAMLAARGARRDPRRRHE